MPSDEDMRAVLEDYWARKMENDPAAGASLAEHMRKEGADDGAGPEASDEGIVQGRFDNNWGSKFEIGGGIGTMREYEILGLCADSSGVSFC